MSVGREPIFGGKDVLAGVRAELGLPQREFAALLGCSIRTVQSAEQGWRKPGPALEKLALLLLASLRHGSDFSDICCWKANGCPPERREECLTHRFGQGHLCWLLTPTNCTGGEGVSWDQKKQVCLDCDLLRGVLRL